ncbi:MAG: hypothetical protein ABIM21_05900, partial [candidate division WOR-3 bacterium]
VYSLMRERIPRRILDVIEIAKDVGEELRLNVYIVGGFVRDLILKVENYDLDFVVEGDGLSFAKAFAERVNGRVNIHERFETAVVIFPDNYRVDVSTARMEYYEEPASLPRVVRGSIKRDLYRRDFTINAMAIKITGDDAYTLFDYYGGMRDIKDRLINVIHNLSFVEDPTRAFRAVRFEQRYGFRIGPQTEKLIKIAVKERIFEKLTGKRIMNELKHMLSEKHAFRMIKRMEELGILQFVHSKLKADTYMEGVFERTREVIAWYELLFKRKQPESWIINAAALLHTLQIDEVKELLHWFNLSRDDREKILVAITDYKSIIKQLESTTDEVKIYWLLKSYPLEAVLFFLAMCEKEEVRQKIGTYLIELVDLETEIKGRDILALGATPGPIIGEILKKVLEAKIKGSVKSREEEISLARELFEAYTRARC